MTREQAYRAGFRIERTRRPMSRGVRYVVTCDGQSIGVAFGRQELSALLDGQPRVLVTLPGNRASHVRPAARYL